MRPCFVVFVIVEWIFALAAWGGGVWVVHAGHTGMAIPAFFFSLLLAVFGVYQLHVFSRTK